MGLSPELARFLDAGSPPVVFTLGSSAVFLPGRFIPKSIEAVRTLGCRAVLLVGKDLRNQPVQLLPEAALISRIRAVFGAVLRAAAVVHQGKGVGTTAQALRAGVPMCVVPYSHDQPDYARRCVGLGVARTVARGQYRAGRGAGGNWSGYRQMVVLGQQRSMSLRRWRKRMEWRPRAMVWNGRRCRFLLPCPRSLFSFHQIRKNIVDTRQMASSFRLQPIEYLGINAHADGHLASYIPQPDHVCQLFTVQSRDVTKIDAGIVAGRLLRGGATKSLAFLFTPLPVRDIFGSHAFPLCARR